MCRISIFTYHQSQGMATEKGEDCQM